MKLGKDYIVIAPMSNNEYKEHSYIIVDGSGKKERRSSTPEKMIRPSYFNKKNGAIRNINLDNIVFIKYKDEVIYGNIEL